LESIILEEEYKLSRKRESAVLISVNDNWLLIMINYYYLNIICWRKRDNKKNCSFTISLFQSLQVTFTFSFPLNHLFYQSRSFIIGVRKTLRKCFDSEFVFCKFWHLFSPCTVYILEIISGLTGKLTHPKWPFSIWSLIYFCLDFGPLI